MLRLKDQVNQDIHEKRKQSQCALLACTLYWNFNELISKCDHVCMHLTFPQSCGVGAEPQCAHWLLLWWPAGLEKSAMNQSSAAADQLQGLEHLAHAASCF